MISLICGTWKTKQRNKRDKTEKSHSRRKQSGSCQRRGAEGMNEIGEGDQEVQTSRCKINELGIWNVHVGNIVNKNTMMIVLYMYMWYCILYMMMKVVKIHKESACNPRGAGWEDALEKEMTIYFSILAWKIPWTEELGGLQSMGSQKSRKDMTQQLNNNSNY